MNEINNVDDGQNTVIDNNDAQSYHDQQLACVVRCDSIEPHVLITNEVHQNECRQQPIPPYLNIYIVTIHLSHQKIWHIMLIRKGKDRIRPRNKLLIREQN